MMLGSLPHTDPVGAWRVVLERFPEIPSWPQLPQRSHLENMYTQFSERFPGLTLRGKSIHVDRQRDLDHALERLYLAYLDGDLAYGRIGDSYAAGLGLLRHGGVAFARPPLALKGQITGPVSWGITVVDEDRRPVLYDEVLQDAVGKHLRMKAAWQERELRRLAAQTIILIDEPYMASFGSSFIALTRGRVIELFEEVFAGLQGIKGVHCCSNTDWSILLNTSLDVLSLDAYDYGETLVEYARDLDEFLARGGTIAWGIVPAGIAAESETSENLVKRLLETIDHLVSAGVPRVALLRAGLITPACGLQALTPRLAQHILDLTASVSAEMRRLYLDPEPDLAKTLGTDIKVDSGGSS